MSPANVVLLLQAALSLLTLVQSNPSLPQPVRDNAVKVAQNAIVQATRSIAAQNSHSTLKTTSIAPTTTPSSTLPPADVYPHVCVAPPQPAAACTGGWKLTTDGTWCTSAYVCRANASSGLTVALNELFSHFWTGTHDSGNITPTWDGIVGNRLKDSRGGIWQAAVFLDVLYAQYQINPTDANAQPIRAEWNYLKSAFSDNDLTTCGAQSAQNFASDDTGWNAAALLEIYDVTKDTRALNAAKGAVQCGFSRWGDSQLGGGLWYSDDKNTKSLYQTALANDAFRIYQLTGDSTYLTSARESYNWMQKYLSRSDDLYWADYGWWSSDHSSAAAALGIERPNDIHLAGSVSFLAGNMGMDILHARMYRLTNDDTYRQRAINTAKAILNTYTDSTGGFLDDRDGWTNGHFVRDWIIEVYPLLSSDLQKKASDVFNSTASAVATSDRTSDGYYGAAWNGPLNSAWDKIGTVPQQIMTSATAIDFVAGPQLINANLPIPTITTTPIVQPAPLSITADLLGQTGEDIVSPLSQTADGVKDVHVRFSNVISPISWIRITTADAGWEAPANGTDWIVALRPEQNPTIVDAYFDSPYLDALHRSTRHIPL